MFGLISAGAVSSPGFIDTLSQMVLPKIGHDILAYLAFAFYLLLLVGGGLTSVLARNLVRAMIGLVVTFLGVAGMYLLLGSPFMAFMQLLIYVGAICVLIFFAIMLVNNTSSGEEVPWPSLWQIATALLAAVAPLVVFAPVIILNAAKVQVLNPNLATPTPLEHLGEGLLSYYVVPFELISIILLVAMAGGVLLSWEKRLKK